MRTLNRYIGVRAARGWLLVGSVLVVLFSIFELVAQLDDVGKGSYGIHNVLIYVACTVPGRVLELASPSILLGTIVALGTLDGGKELLAMRASGISTGRIAWSVLRVGSLAILGFLLVAQFVVPTLEQQARLQRKLALTRVGTLLPSGGFWTLDNNRFVNVRAMLPGGTLGDVEIYEFDEDGELRTFTRAGEAQIKPDGQWVLSYVTQSIWTQRGTSSRTLPSLTLDRLLTLHQVNVLSLPPEALSLSDLLRFVRILEGRGQNAQRYRMVFWQKLALPLNVFAMILLAVPFAIGKARETGLGWRVLVGSILGIAYYFLTQALGYFGLLMELNPAAIAILPALFILFVAYSLLKKIV